jgi:hypothetical protein
MRQVPQLGQQPQQFSMPQVQPTYQQFTGTMPGMQQPAPSPATAVQHQIQALALDIYTRTVGEYIGLCGMNAADAEVLRQRATNAQAAARAYFESMGVQFDE